MYSRPSLPYYSCLSIHTILSAQHCRAWSLRALNREIRDPFLAFNYDGIHLLSQYIRSTILSQASYFSLVLVVCLICRIQGCGSIDQVSGTGGTGVGMWAVGSYHLRWFPAISDGCRKTVPKYIWDTVNLIIFDWTPKVWLTRSLYELKGWATGWDCVNQETSQTSNWGVRRLVWTQRAGGKMVIMGQVNYW